MTAFALFGVIMGCGACFGLVWLATDGVGVAALRALALRWRMRCEGGRTMRGSTAQSGWRLLGGVLAHRATGIVGRMASARSRREEAERRRRCLNELPELIDVAVLGLSAGISFDAALEIYCARYSTTMALLLHESLRSWRIGLASRSEALHLLADELGIDAFSTFVETVTESLDFGAPLAKSLTDQAKAIRDERRYIVQERIEKAPVKMLVPTGTLILPAMLLAILGPLLASLTVVAGSG